MAKKYQVLILILLLGCFPFGIQAALNIQDQRLIEAAHVDQAYDLNLWLPAVLEQESDLCTNKHDSKVDPLGWGCGQLHVQTVLEVVGLKVTARELDQNDSLNMALSGYILWWCKDHFPWSVNRTLACYHWGLRPAYELSIPYINRHYVNSVALYRILLLKRLRLLLHLPAKPTKFLTYQPLLPHTVLVQDKKGNW